MKEVLMRKEKKLVKKKESMMIVKQKRPYAPFRGYMRDSLIALASIKTL